MLNWYWAKPNADIQIPICDWDLFQDYRLMHLHLNMQTIQNVQVVDYFIEMTAMEGGSF